MLLSCYIVRHFQLQTFSVLLPRSVNWSNWIQFDIAFWILKLLSTKYCENYCKTFVWNIVHFLHCNIQRRISMRAFREIFIFYFLHHSFCIHSCFYYVESNVIDVQFVILIMYLIILFALFVNFLPSAQVSHRNLLPSLYNRTLNELWFHLMMELWTWLVTLTMERRKLSGVFICLAEKVEQFMESVFFFSYNFWKAFVPINKISFVFAFDSFLRKSL